MLTSSADNIRSLFGVCVLCCFVLVAFPVQPHRNVFLEYIDNRTKNANISEEMPIAHLFVRKYVISWNSDS